MATLFGVHHRMQEKNPPFPSRRERGGSWFSGSLRIGEAY